MKCRGKNGEGDNNVPDHFPPFLVDGEDEVACNRLVFKMSMRI